MRTRQIPLVLAVLVLAACGGGGAAAPKVEGPLVKGPNGVWIFHPAGKPKALVIFFHGQGGPREATPANHRPWIDHLAAQGDLVVYPRYELDYAQAVIGPAVAGIRRAIERTSVKGLPVVAIGYSRGGGLAVEYAAVARHEHAPVPDLVADIFGVPYGEQAGNIDLRTLDPKGRIVVFVGDRDPGSIGGAQAMLGRLRKARFPGFQVRLHFVRSHDSFLATHLSFLRSTPAAQAAFWRPLDQLVSQVVA